MPHVRPYSPADRAAVRSICCETGFMGSAVDPLFSDREAFADFFTRYYTDLEPEAALVVVDADRVVGYLLGCLDPQRYRSRQPALIATRTAPGVLRRLITGRYGSDDVRFLSWFVLRGASETPAVPPRAGHFHLNLLPEYRHAGVTLSLFNTFKDLAAARGCRRIYCQIQTFDTRRPDAVFRRLGFCLHDRRAISRFERLRPGVRVYVSTFVTDLA